MSIEKLSFRPTENATMLPTKDSILDLQKVQQRHDVEYHPDIVALGTIGRLRHMALHNAKYAARLADAEARGDGELFERILIDGLIIGISTANVLAQDLRKTPDVANEQPLSETPNWSNFTFEYLQAVGRMAKACESIDHLEDYPFRPEIKAANARLVSLLLDEAEARGLDVTMAYRRRLDEVERNSGFALFASEIDD